MNDTKPRKILTDPVTVILATLGAIAHALGVGWVQAVVSVLWTNVSTLFTALSVSGFTLAPQVAWIPEGPVTTAALVAGAAYVLKLADKMIDKIQAKL